VNLRRTAHCWLIWLALLLPIAQAMAGVHALSHVNGERQDDGVAHLVHCDLCLTAVDLGTGAPTTEPMASVDAELSHAAPLLARGWQPRAVSIGLPPARAPPATA